MVVISLEQGADLHMGQLMPLPLTVSCFGKIQIGFTFLVLAHLDSPGKRPVKRVVVLLYEYSNPQKKRKNAQVKSRRTSWNIKSLSIKYF